MRRRPFLKTLTASVLTASYPTLRSYAADTPSVTDTANAADAVHATDTVSIDRNRVCETESVPYPLSNFTSLRQFIGVAHIGGAYSTRPGNASHFLREGAERILELGSETIKLSLLRPASMYPFHSQWDPAWSNTSFAALQSPYFRDVLTLPFRTIHLWTYSDHPNEHYWNAGPISANQAESEELQFYRIASYLYETYRDTGKTFVLSHWEGDWAVRGHTDVQRDPPPAALEGMRQWLTARQRGVDRARREYESPGNDSSQCRVYHAAEVNLVGRCLPGHGSHPGVTTEVLSHTEVPLDLVSYSAYDTQQNRAEFRAALELLADRLPAKPQVDDRCGGRSGRVFIGEYGYPQEAPNATSILSAIVENVLRTAAMCGVRWTVFWQLYCNEPLRRPVEKNDDCRGFWLIRPDGTNTPLWQEFHERMTSSEPLAHSSLH